MNKTQWGEKLKYVFYERLFWMGEYANGRHLLWSHRTYFSGFNRQLICNKILKNIHGPPKKGQASATGRSRIFMRRNQPSCYVGHWPQPPRIWVFWWPDNFQILKIHPRPGFEWSLFFFPNRFLSDWNYCTTLVLINIRRSCQQKLSELFCCVVKKVFKTLRRVTLFGKRIQHCSTNP